MQVLMIKPRYPGGPFAEFVKRWSYFTSMPVVSSLFPDDCSIKYIDEDYEEIDYSLEPDYVMLTSLTVSAQRAYRIASDFKERNIPVIMGGIHASLAPEEAKLHADAVVIGEVEPVFADLFDDMTNKNLKNFYKGGHHPASKNIGSLDMRLVKSKPYLRNKTVTQLVRGCPYDCTFCAATRLFGSQFRYRDFDAVVKEIEKQIELSNNRMVSFLDDNIFSNRRVSSEFFEKIKPLRIKWWSQGTLNIADHDRYLQQAKESGCVCVFVGIEDITSEGLKEIDKKSNRVQRYKDQIAKLHDNDIIIMSGFIFGLDSHGPGIFDSVLEFIQENSIEIPFFTILTPYPGTRLYSSLEAQGRLLTKDWSRYDLETPIFKPRGLSVYELQEGYERVKAEAYSPARIEERISSLSPKTRFMLKRSFLDGSAGG